MMPLIMVHFTWTVENGPFSDKNEFALAKMEMTMVLTLSTDLEAALNKAASERGVAPVGPESSETESWWSPVRNQEPGTIPEGR
jgi:hypothetical protein